MLGEVPELVDLERKRIFEQKEIKQIVRKRRKFEYSMVNKHVVKKDFLHYIEYEIAVECLRRQRSPQVQSVWTFSGETSSGLSTAD